jgi:hypothetical protein
LSGHSLDDPLLATVWRERFATTPPWGIHSKNSVLVLRESGERPYSRSRDVNPNWTQISSLRRRLHDPPSQQPPQAFPRIASQPSREERYSPGDVLDAIPTPIIGTPDQNRLCTSYLERQNGTLRQWCKRLTRLTYAFTKKWEDLQAALALHFAFYNFYRIHGSLRVTPTMEVGITDHVRNIGELVRHGVTCPPFLVQG